MMQPGNVALVASRSDAYVSNPVFMKRNPTPVARCFM